MGLGHCEKSHVGKECFWPPFMILATLSQPRPLLLLTQDRPQPPSRKAIGSAKGHRMSVLEVVKPTAQHRIELGNNGCHTISSRALGLDPNPLSQRLKALAPNPTPPRLEAIAQKLKALSLLPTVPYMGLIRTKTQPVLFYPTSHFLKRGLGLLGRLAQHHKVIGVAHHAVTLLLDPTVQRMKIDVGQQWTDRLHPRNR